MWQKLFNFLGPIPPLQEQTLGETHHKEELVQLQGGEKGRQDHRHLLYHRQQNRTAGRALGRTA